MGLQGGKNLSEASYRHLFDPKFHFKLQKVEVGLLNYFLHRLTEEFIIHLPIKTCCICQLNNRLVKIVLFKILYLLQKGVSAMSSIAYESGGYSIITQSIYLFASLPLEKGGFKSLENPPMSPFAKGGSFILNLKIVIQKCKQYNAPLNKTSNISC